MFSLEKLVRTNIRALKPYSSARDEFQGREGIFLDANENPFGYLNRYPDPHQTALKEKLSALKNMPVENIFIGNGSDEVIDLLMRIFCQPGKDKIIVCPPTYGMYEVAAHINEAEILNIPLTADFQIHLEKITCAVEDSTAIKLIFLCSPNNPTGNNLKDIEQVLKTFPGIVVVDEAYIDFSEAPSCIEKLADYPNLVVLQTCSKAWGLAAARVGFAFASKEIITLLNKVKPPYNVSQLNQEAAIDALSRVDEFQQQKALILAQRAWLQQALSALNIVQKIYPSDANFLLVEVTDADAVYDYLVKRKVIVRNRNSVVKNCIRVTVGTAQENQNLMEALKNYAHEKSFVY